MPGRPFLLQFPRQTAWLGPVLYALSPTAALPREAFILKKKLTIRVRNRSSRDWIVKGGKDRDPEDVILLVPEEETETMVWNDYEERLAEAAVGEKEFVWVRSPQEIMDNLDREAANGTRKYYRHNRPDDETLLGFKYRQINTFLSPFGDVDLMMYTEELLSEEEKEVFHRVLVEGSCTRKEAAGHMGLGYWGVKYRIRKIRRLIREEWLEDE